MDDHLDRIPTAPVVAAGLVGGFAAARYSGHRALGGAVLAAGGAVAARSWRETSGPGVMGVLLGTYLAAFGASHPLAKKLGAWPSVLTVTAVAAGAAHALADRSDATF
ncbi:hypothetical protein [Nocardioides acrostichi]|uniref:Uncharacterized protein n=1 Tax=Nocardioides acrostichi TaxID=2784339 RepID=A0A930YET9_9ACTN|nr:hypothetical protein [Nocardioides acrostichi]MBF4163794.1 hypothetical protein [Nocardioides acrostichi]